MTLQTQTLETPTLETRDPIARKRTGRLVALAGLVLAMFALVLAMSPPAQAQDRGALAAPEQGCPKGWVEAPVPGGCLPNTVKAAVPAEAIFDCPDGFVLSRVGCVAADYAPSTSDPIGAIFECPRGTTLTRFGCVPTRLTSNPVRVAVFNCPDRWVQAAAGVGACTPGLYSAADPTGVINAPECPKYWEPATAGVGTCQPGFLVDASGDNTIGVALCPKRWTPAAVPGGCQPGWVKPATPEEGIALAQHHCAFGQKLCQPMVDAIKALGGECVESPYGETCTLPDFPEDKD